MGRLGRSLKDLIDWVAYLENQCGAPIIKSF